MSILDIPVLSLIRRNHGLEHATLTILSRMRPSVSAAGISFPGGFLIMGEVETEDLQAASREALERMNNGEHNLAVHPNCGTNFATSGIIAGALAWLGMAGARDSKEKRVRLPLVITLVTLSLIYSRALGPIVQEKITTSGYPEGLRIVDIISFRTGNMKVHRVITAG